MAGTYIDFDAALAEATEQPVVVRYLGRDWELYASMPARPVFRILRLQAEGRDQHDLSQREQLDFLRQMVPAEVLEAWIEGGITLAQMGRLLASVVAAYRDADTGEASGPAEGPSMPSSTGVPSKQTSPVSTPSTCPEP